MMFSVLYQRSIRWFSCESTDSNTHEFYASVSGAPANSLSPRSHLTYSISSMTADVPDSPEIQTEMKQYKDMASCLIVGNYCHDVLIKDDVVLAESLGGAASFISAVLDGLSVTCTVVSKVGPDFSYSVTHAPVRVQSSHTTLFHAHFSSQIHRHDRILKRVRACNFIAPCDLQFLSRFRFGLAVGVGGEIVPETLEKMLDICDTVLVDVQSLIRVFDPADGTVTLVQLKDSGFHHLLPRIGFLKASADEAPYVDVEEARRKCCVVVTNGKEGCTIYWRDGEQQIAPFPTMQVDPTGAGDSFLGGLAAGLANGLAVPDAALLGNFFGSLTVGQLGLPQFDLRLLQAVKDEVQRKSFQFYPYCEKGSCNMMIFEPLKFHKPLDHEEFLAVLSAARAEVSCPNGECERELPSSLSVVEAQAGELHSSELGVGAPPNGSLEVQTKFQ